VRKDNNISSTNFFHSWSKFTLFAYAGQ